MRTSNQLLLLSMLSALSPAALADDATGAVDTSQWVCESCKFEDSFSGTVEVGATSVSDQSAKFGDFTGLDKDGGYFIGEGSASYRNKDSGEYWKLNASNLGLDSRAIDAEGGKQGSYKLQLKYDGLPHTVSDNAQTPFAGSGGASLTLPGFVKAGTTDTMTSLPSSLRQVDIGTERKRLGMGAAWMPSSTWEYAVNFRHETKDGTKRTAGAFFVDTAQLIEPVDYVTDQVDASATYSGKKFQLKLAYYGSTFKNNNESLSWVNPYATPGFLATFPNSASGQLALPPDNEFHQIQAAAGYQFTDRTRASADIAIGRMTQDSSFLQYGSAVTGPGGSLSGRANTFDVALKLSSAVTDRMRLNAVYTHNDRDNDTQQSVYQVYVTDMFVGTPRTNLPYGFKQDKLKLSGDYRASQNLRGALGADFDSHQRTYSDVDKTRENTVWGKATTRIADKVDLSLKLARGERRNSGSFQPIAGITPDENPLLRRFNLANRTRDTATLRADFAVGERINVGLGIDTSEDKYSDSSIGLTNSKDSSVNGDVSVIITDQTQMHFFANHQEIKSKQTGSQAFSTPDWSADNKDTIDFFGLGIKHTAIEGKLDIGADYSFTHSRSEIDVDTSATAPGFPHLKTTLDSLKIYAAYRLENNVTLQAGYWYERYDSKDWMLDGVAVSAIPNVLTLGLQPPQYHLNVVRLSAKYAF
ncbi:MAG: MtrB/PioB family decaheme-associated outer membrane protein [Georgfuchsia sp.]